MSIDTYKSTGQMFFNLCQAAIVGCVVMIRNEETAFKKLSKEYRKQPGRAMWKTSTSCELVTKCYLKRIETTAGRNARADW